MGSRGTIPEASPFKPEEDVEKLRSAMKGAGVLHAHTHTLTHVTYKHSGKTVTDLLDHLPLPSSVTNDL